MKIKKYEKDIVVCGYVAAKGVFNVLEHEYAKLAASYDKRYLDSLISKHDIRLSFDDLEFVEDMYEIAREGIIKSLFNMSEDRGEGFSIYLREVPLLQGSIEVCEFFGLNPYNMLSDARLVICESAGKFILANKKLGMELRHIGCTHKELVKLILDKGYMSCMNKADEDEILKIMPEYFGG